MFVFECLRLYFEGTNEVANDCAVEDWGMWGLRRSEVKRGRLKSEEGKSGEGKNR